MSDVLIQIVDENDKPVGSATIDEAQLQGLITRIVRVMAEDGHDRVLLQKRIESSKVYPNCWDNSSSGHVDAGESYEIAAARELQEEVGIKNVALNEMGTYYTEGKYHERTLRRFNRVYQAVVQSDTKLTLQADEVSDAKWFTVAEVKELIKNHPEQVTDGLVDVIARYY